MTGKRPLNNSPKDRTKKKKAVGISSQTDNDGFKSVRSRATPALLVEKLELLNAAQRKAVVDLGFGRLLDLKIREVPQKLAYFVLSNFDCDQCDILLPPGDRRLHIDEDDVHLTLGLPKGRINIVSVKTSLENSLLIEWKARACPGNPSRILASDVALAMIKESTGGDWFKRHFLVLMVACLVEHTSSGYINCRVFDRFQNLCSIKDINWCGYVIDILQSRTRKWQKSPTNQFLGPVLFLVGFYIDRVVMDSRTAPRTFPTLKGWDQDLIRKRQLAEASVGLFGSGYICARFIPPIDVQGSNGIIGCETLTQTDVAGTSKSAAVDVVDGTSKSAAVDVVGQIAGLFRAAKNMSAAVRAYMDLVHEADKAVFDNEGVLRLLSATQLIVGSGIAIPDQTQSTQMFWDDPKNLEIICEMESAAQKAVAYHDYVAEIPSFSIGLTQAEKCGFDNGVEVDMFSTMTPASISKVDRVVNASAERGHIANLDAVVGNSNKVASVRVQELRSNRVLDRGPSISVASPVESNSERELRSKRSQDKGKEKLDGKNDDGIAIKELRRKAALELISKKVVSDEIEQERNSVVTTSGTLLVEDDKVIRSKRDQKKPMVFSSPFLVRIADPSQRLSKEEKQIFCWIFHNDNEDKFQTVFRNGRDRVNRIDMKTLAPTIPICTYIIDVWSLVLNQRENLRAPSSPYRFFASTCPAVPAILSANYPENMAINESKFISFLDVDLERIGNVDISKVQVFFFPCHVNTYYFLVCVNLLKSKIDVIDGSDAYDDAPPGDKIFGNFPATLQSYFSKFLCVRGLASKGESVSKFEIKVLHMPWRDRSNVVDIGLFLMRHMETYMGESQDRWDCGLRKGWKKQLKYLRARYAHAILVSEVNLEATKIKNFAASYFTNFTKSRAFDFDKAIVSTDYTVGL